MMPIIIIESSSFKFKNETKSSTDAVLVVGIGLLLFITGAVAATITLLVILKMYVRGKYIRTNSSTSDNSVQRNEVSRQNKNPKDHTNVKMERSSYRYSFSDDNADDAKSTSTNDSGCGRDPKYDKPAKDLWCADVKNNEGRNQ